MVLADQACLFAQVVDVPIYDTLIADQVAYILKDSGARLVFASDRDQMNKALEAGADKVSIMTAAVKDRDFVREMIMGIGAWHGRLYLGSAKVADH